MLLARDYVHQQIVTFWLALQAHPALMALVKAARMRELKEHMERLAPVLAAVRTGGEDSQLKEVLATIEETHAVLGRLHHGVRYLYPVGHPIYAKLGTLTLGRDAQEDHVRLTTLVRELPEAQPAFLWAEDLSLQYLTTLCGRQEAAAETEDEVVRASRSAQAQLRELRPASQELWSGYCVKWIEANVEDPSEHHVWGLERRRSTRASAEKEETGNTPAENVPAAPSAPTVPARPSPSLEVVAPGE